MINFDFANLSSEVLALQIVAYQALGIRKDLAISCMQELARRKVEKIDSNFDFEKFIADRVVLIKAKSENQTMNSSSISTILSSIKGASIPS